MLAETGSRATKTTRPLGDRVARVGRVAGLAATRDQVART
jgi:hypothetical protein